MALSQLHRFYNQFLTSMPVLIPSQQCIRFTQTSDKPQSYFHLSLLRALRNEKQCFFVP